MQLSTVPAEFYEQEYSGDTQAAISDHANEDAKALTVALERLGEQGDASAYEALGEIYSGGAFGVKRDPVRGCDYFELVGARRADALHNLATCYYSGNGRRQDLAKAREFYVQAAEAGWRMSFCAYGNMLVRGEGGPVDAEEGIHLCRMTAVLGDADAQTDYGTYLLTGNGVERDPVAARFMLEQAAAQQQRNAAFLLGQIHTKGDGTPTDHRLAADWFVQAYEWGRSDAALEAARSFLRRGYIENDDGSATVKPELLGDALEWSRIALSAEANGSERQEQAVELEKLLIRLIDAAEGTTGG
ncbi:tetratricopeptide repeat protein [Erythrobacter sp. GH1-10]|uniref:tetratricopeptide repeat protein n=1 Tax=Erythrobacter sp. GH1-10 TaxID=3349334 RepID=UPI003877D918